MLDEPTKARVRERLQALTAPVRLIHFTQELGCETCTDARLLLQDVAKLSERVQLEVHNLQLERAHAAALGIDRVPATVVANGRGARIRFLGLPVGYEFATLLEAILDVSSGHSHLQPGTIARLQQIQQPIHLQVYVTPT
jgi:alkyl hydroperoxide reductase subunit AhpF